MKTLKKLHDEIKEHKFRLNNNRLYAKDYGKKLRRFILTFYEKSKHIQTGMFIHEALSNAWHFEDGASSYVEYYKDGKEMDSDIILAVELIIQDIHIFIKTRNINKLHMYYTGSNFTGSRKSTLIINNGKIERIKGWK